MNPTKKTARIAGLLYLLMGVTGAFGLMFVPSKIIVAGNATATPIILWPLSYYSGWAL